MAENSYEYPYVLTIVRGNTREITFTFRDADDELVDLTGSTVKFKADLDGSYITKTMTNGGTDGTATLSLTAAETRSFPLYASEKDIRRFEIERTISSTQETLLFGKIKAVGGINDD